MMLLLSFLCPKYYMGTSHSFGNLVIVRQHLEAWYKSKTISPLLREQCFSVIFSVLRMYRVGIDGEIETFG